MRRALIILSGLIVAIAAFFWHIGYIGGQPFIDLPPRGRPAPFAAVVMTGDMGFAAGMAGAIGERLAADGVAVVGINALTAFRTARTPIAIARLIARAEQRAMALGHTTRVVLVAQSFGADMLHVGLTRLPAPARAHVDRIALIVPGSTVTYRASPTEIFDFGQPAYPALPTAQVIDWVPLLCVQGVEEDDSLCPLLTGANVTRVALPGGHPMHRDTDAVYATVKHFLFTTGEPTR